jgi:hypothetical protein
MQGEEVRKAGDRSVDSGAPRARTVRMCSLHGRRLSRSDRSPALHSIVEREKGGKIAGAQLTAAPIPDL